MSLLSDERKVRCFIENDEPCPADLILGYYLKCKRHGTQVPPQIEAFIDTILEKIVKDRNHGRNTDFYELFGFKKLVGGKISKLAKENRVLLIGIDIDTLKEEGKTYTEAISIISDERGICLETVRKAYTHYNRIPDSLDGFDSEDYSD